MVLKYTFILWDICMYVRLVFVFLLSCGQKWAFVRGDMNHYITTYFKLAIYAYLTTLTVNTDDMYTLCQMATFSNVVIALKFILTRIFHCKKICIKLCLHCTRSYCHDSSAFIVPAFNINIHPIKCTVTENMWDVELGSTCTISTSAILNIESNKWETKSWWREFILSLIVSKSSAHSSCNTLL